ncbi:MAG: hypothetical protein ACLSGH_14805, partial [Faecalibacillus intestinalis]|uniref:hypothetical protein n=1 Tax=Faecalibacillus intestinalis TaxID=1982626 RepID=UPI003996BC9F
ACIHCEIKERIQIPIFSYFRPFMMENRYPITKPNKTLDPTLSKMLPFVLLHISNLPLLWGFFFAYLHHIIKTKYQRHLNAQNQRYP